MPFQPGNNANPGGRPKEGKIWREALNRALKRREHEDPLALEKLADKLIAKVEQGDIIAIKEFGDRMDGKVPQTIGQSDEHEKLFPTDLKIKLVRPDPGNTGSI